MVKLDKELVEKKKKELSSQSREQILANFHAKYRGPDSLDETLEASHIVLGEEYELYLSDEQYTELTQRPYNQRTTGEECAIKSLEILQKVHEMGPDNYFGLVRRLPIFLWYSVISIILCWIGISVLGSLIFTVLTRNFFLFIFPLNLLSARGTVAGLTLVWVLAFVVPMFVASSFIPNKSKVMESYERNKDRLSRKTTVD